MPGALLRQAPDPSATAAPGDGSVLSPPPLPNSSHRPRLHARASGRFIPRTWLPCSAPLLFKVVETRMRALSPFCSAHSSFILPLSPSPTSHRRHPSVSRPLALHLQRLSSTRPLYDAGELILCCHYSSLFSFLVFLCRLRTVKDSKSAMHFAMCFDIKIMQSAMLFVLVVQCSYFCREKTTSKNNGVGCDGDDGSSRHGSACLLGTRWVQV